MTPMSTSLSVASQFDLEEVQKHGSMLQDLPRRKTVFLCKVFLLFSAPQLSLDASLLSVYPFACTSGTIPQYLLGTRGTFPRGLRVFPPPP
ncbi:hypothetical protein KUCAC02_016955 [Chaenocephalus aceratus]|nr:hypothetical protein KUCAC02_016955 [Chaenocephalus aceratus]